MIHSFGDWFAGYDMDPYALLGNSFQAVKDYDRIVTLVDIDFSSHCEHHMAPFIGRIHLAYLPNQRLAGISKLVRVVEAFTKRLQVQERLTAEIAQCINATLEPSLPLAARRQKLLSGHCLAGLVRILIERVSSVRLLV